MKCFDYFGEDGMVQRSLFPKKLTREELNSLVNRAADLIRTAVNYKFILVLLFLKRLNDVLKYEKRLMKERLIKEVGLSEKEAEKFEYSFNGSKTEALLLCEELSNISSSLCSFNINVVKAYQIINVSS